MTTWPVPWHILSAYSCNLDLLVSDIVNVYHYNENHLCPYRANGKTLKSLPDSGRCICKGAGRNLDKLMHKCHFVSRVILVVGRPEFDAVLCRPPLLLHSQSTPDKNVILFMEFYIMCICGWNNYYANKNNW